MNKKEFNEYCAEMMKYKFSGLTWYKNGEIVSSGELYNPFYITDQLIEVFEYLVMKDDSIAWTDVRILVMKKGSIKKAMREFIMSTKEAE
jgi:hypothetical protein